MDGFFGAEGPAILKLRKWAPFNVPLILSEFREAFISPSRQLLLLLSCQYEALVLPITEGVSKDGHKSEGCQSVQDAVLCSRAELPSDSLGDIPCVSGSSVDCDYGSPSRGNSTRYESHPYIYGVKSLSWGVCDDAYTQHKCMPFREFLFVSGAHGIKVHAFREFNGSSDNREPVFDDESGQGRWVEWGPSDVTAMENVVCETSVGVSGENADDAYSRKGTHKIWLRSFMTEVETVKFDGNLWTKFPERSSFPCGADVVSFSLLDDILPFLEFFSHDSALDTDGGIKAMSDSSTASSGLYKCSHIFSSNSHHQIGFHLTSVDCDSEDSVDEYRLEKSKNLVVVSRLSISGIRWVSFVKLQDSMTDDPAIRWVDFCFSENLIACLSSSGVIFLYLVTSGEYVSHVDIMKACGLYSHINSYEQDQLSASVSIQKPGKVDDKLGYASCSIANKNLFSRLIVAPYTSLLAAIDNNGVVYVLSASSFVPTEYYSSENFFPNFQHSGLGKMVAWMVCGSKIGQRKAYSDISGSFHPKSEHVWDGQVSLLDENEFDDFCIQQDLHVVEPLYKNCNGSFVASRRGQRIHGSKLRTKFMRRFFLPTERFTEYDCVCFSPFGLTRLYRKNKDPKESWISHTNVHADSKFYDDRCLEFGHKTSHREKKEVFIGEAIGCTFEGCFYLVTQGGLSVFLPSVSVSSNFLPVESIGCRKLCTYKELGCLVGSSFERKEVIMPISPWKVEILDRVILFDGPEAADNLCLENGWNLKLSRIRGLLMAMDCLKFDQIQQSLARLVDVNLAEEGILRLIFAVVFIIFCMSGNDYEVSAASRLLSLATSFATKTIRKYGLLRNKEEKNMSQGFARFQILSPPHPPLSKKLLCRKLREMANFLEIIRHLQLRLGSKIKISGQGLEDDEKAVVLVNENSVQDASRLLAPAEPVRFETVEQEEPNKSEKLAMVSMDSLVSKGMTIEDKYKESSLVLQEGVLGTVENPKEMIARWKIENLDLKSVVKDALLSGRLPLAVLQLHLHHSNLVSDNDSEDNFTEIRDVGIAIAYDLFQKGETGLAVAMLQRLGENVEASLKQLLFGTLKRSLRVQLADELNIHGYLGPFEWKTLENLSLIERLYPSCSFWKTFVGRKKEVMKINLSSGLPEDFNICLLSSHPFGNLIIECGEVNGAVLGPWANLDGTSSMYEGDDENAQTGYWVAAAVWTDAWDQRTVDRIILDQPHFMGINVPWEAQLEYHICHNDEEEVLKLLNQIPSFVICSGTLQISLDYLQTVSSAGRNPGYNGNSKYICSPEELNSVCMDIPEIKVFRSSAGNLSCMWLRTYMEKELMKKFIFLKEFWEGTEQIVSLLACSGIITSTHVPCKDESCNSLGDMQSSDDGATYMGVTMQALHKLVVHHCVLYNLPNLLDLYLDNHNLAIDEDSLCSLQEAAGDCEWARWMLLSRMKGHEYDASFSNARSIMSKHSVTDSRISVRNIGEMVCTVDDVAEAGSELAAIATLMYSRVPIQTCLSSGSVNRHGKSSAQCTLENLRHALQQFPTLWRTLVAACLGQDLTSRFSGPKAANAFGGSELSEYLNLRNNIFCSSGHDTSLLQLLPYWFPKAIRRLVQLFVQGPLGWHSLSGLSGETLYDRDIEFYLNSDEHSEISAVTWEATIQKRVEEELYDSSLVEHQLGLEHHLHRGRVLAAFNQLIGARIQKLKSERLSVDSIQGQTNVQSDVQRVLATITQSEKSLLSSVIPLAIMHFENSMLVASCVLLLELCGLSASVLRVDVAALRRISIFYKSIEDDENRQQTPKCSVLHAISPRGSIAESLAQALADEHMHQDNASMSKKESQSLIAGKCPSRALLLVLQHLEKASLPHISNGNTCGYWLLSGVGDGNELRSQQKAASQHWNLVTLFCQMHQLPLSTKYLDLLARDNDWVGFLSEAQTGGYPFATVLQVASKEFSDPRLGVHLTTVLKGTQSRNKSCSSSYLENNGTRNATPFSDEKLRIPVELFEILAECEKQKYPGKALLAKAKELSWSLLAVIASCFTDVTPLSCLAVWLEITAARETSSIKVNDIASQIASSVQMAVAATNSLPAGRRSLTFHYNRQNPKRRRLMEPMLTEPMSKNSDITSGSAGVSTFLAQIVQEERKAQVGELVDVSCDSHEGPDYLSKMVAVLCEQHLFLPLLRAFEMFLPSCCLLPFIRALQAFSQMRLSEASAHLGSFSPRIKEEPIHLQSGVEKGHIGALWISSTAVRCADSMLSTCPSPYEKRCLLQLLAAIDFADGGFASAYYRRLYWKINLAEPLLRKDDDLNLGNEALDDISLLSALENNGHWDQARNWARQLEASGGMWKNVVHRVTETQAESMVAEWKEFLWDVPDERVALWGHCQTLFIRCSFAPLQAGLFFLKHAETMEKDLPAKELHELLLLSLQWLSGMITLSNPVYPLHLLREIETRAWLLAVKAEAQVKSEGGLTSANSTNCSSVIDRTASIISKMDNHINAMGNKLIDKHDAREYIKDQGSDAKFSRARRKAKVAVLSRRSQLDTIDQDIDAENDLNPLIAKNDIELQDDNFKVGLSFSKWEERLGPVEMERAILSLLEFGQVAAAKQLQQKLSPAFVPSEFILVDVTLKLAAMSTPESKVHLSTLDGEVQSVIQKHTLPGRQDIFDPLEVLEILVTAFGEGSGRGFCKRIIAIVKAANTLGLSFSEACEKQPVEVLQLLSLKAQESFEEAKLLVQTHSMSATSIAKILAESFLKGLLAAHRGGYMELQKEEGPSPLLWRFSDFLKWAELCPSEPEIGHALMRLVITGQEIPHACEVELLILSHHFYKSSACLDGVDVLVALAATRVEAYVSEGDFSCLARLLTGVGNFQALNFILGILIENGQLEILLQKYSAAAEEDAKTAEAVKGFRMSVLTSLKHFNPNDLDAIAMVYNHFDMKHEAAALLVSRAEQSSRQWFRCNDKDQNEDLLDSMRFFIEAAEVHSSLDAGNMTRKACAQASLVSLQIRMPDIQWLHLSDTKARRILVEQSRFQEALIVAEAYGLNQPSEWALVLWNQMLKPELTEEFVAEFVAVLPLQPSMLVELAKFYRAEVVARGDQSQFSVWLTGGGMPAEWARNLGRSFRCLLRRTGDLRLRLELARVATGFTDVVDACLKALDRVPENAGPLVLRKGHGGAYLPLM